VARTSRVSFKPPKAAPVSGNEVADAAHWPWQVNTAARYARKKRSPLATQKQKEGRWMSDAVCHAQGIWPPRWPRGGSARICSTASNVIDSCAAANGERTRGYPAAPLANIPSRRQPRARHAGSRTVSPETLERLSKLPPFLANVPRAGENILERRLHAMRRAIDQ